MLAQPPRALLLKKPCFRASRLSTRIVPQALNKTEFIAAVRDSIESTPGIESLTNPDFDKIVSGVFDTIQDTVADGESITITGFGKFERRCCCFPSFSGFTHYRPNATQRGPHLAQGVGRLQGTEGKDRSQSSDTRTA